MKFDFEEMARLIRDDPVQFARLREDLIRQHIEKSHQTEYLTQLQMTLDETRYSTQPGLQSGEKLMEMLVEYAANLVIHHERLQEIMATLKAPVSKHENSAQQT